MSVSLFHDLSQVALPREAGFPGSGRSAQDAVAAGVGAFRPSWWLEPRDDASSALAGADGGAQADGSDDALRFGGHCVPLSEISSYRLDEIRGSRQASLVSNTANVCAALGLVAAICGFAPAGPLEACIGIFVLSVFWALAAAFEGLGIDTGGQLRVTIFTRTGKEIPFPGGDARDLEGLVALLRSVLKR